MFLYFTKHIIIILSQKQTFDRTSRIQPFLSFNMTATLRCNHYAVYSSGHINITLVNDNCAGHRDFSDFSSLHRTNEKLPRRRPLSPPLPSPPPSRWYVGCKAETLTSSPSKNSSPQLPQRSWQVQVHANSSNANKTTKTTTPAIRWHRVTPSNKAILRSTCIHSGG